MSTYLFFRKKGRILYLFVFLQGEDRTLQVGFPWDKSIENMTSELLRKIAIYCVNYHSYDSLRNYLASIDRAAKSVKGKLDIVVIVADNSVPATPVDYNPRHFSLRILPTCENKGYFGAVRHAMQTISPAAYDYSIVSNVDVLLSEGFFLQLSSFPSDGAEVGWIAPEIYSQTLGFDFNPQAVCAYSLKKLKLLRLMFKYPWLLRAKQRLLHVHRHFNDAPAGPIYAGHGSFMILTRLFFSRCGIIDYPIFLYGEEIYLAETCRQQNLLVVYEPKIKVGDIGRVSTGNIPSRQYCKYNYQAIDYIIRRFYKG